MWPVLERDSCCPEKSLHFLYIWGRVGHFYRLGQVRGVKFSIISHQGVPMHASGSQIFPARALVLSGELCLQQHSAM